MAGDGSIATTAIITGGLTGGHAPVDPCKSGIITSAFSLYCQYTPPPVVSNGGGGGPYPGRAWNKFNPGEIKNFYKPVKLTDYYIVPRENEAEFFKRRNIVKMVVKVGDLIVEKEYAVPEKHIKMLVKASNVVNYTREQIDIVVDKVSNVITNIVVSAKNLRLRK